MDVTESQPLTEQQRNEILAELREYQAAKDLPDWKMARLIGCSPAVWSQMKRAKYTGNTDKYLHQARRNVAAKVDAITAPATDYVETAFTRRVMQVCRIAWEMPCMGKVIAPSGAGKTAALREFARRNPDHVVYLQAGPAIGSMRDLLAEIAMALGLKASTGWSAAQLFGAVRHKCADAYAGGSGLPLCLVIDEATTLAPKAINALRSLHDLEDCRAAVVLADTWRLDGELASRHGIPGGYEQLRSRFGAVAVMTANEEIPAEDVRRVAESLLAGVGHKRPLAVRALEYLHGLAQQDGRLRNVVFRLLAANLLAERNQATPQFSLQELDYVAPLHGAESRLKHTALPFAPEEPARKAG